MDGQIINIKKSKNQKQKSKEKLALEVNATTKEIRLIKERRKCDKKKNVEVLEAFKIDKKKKLIKAKLVLLQ